MNKQQANKQINKHSLYVGLLHTAPTANAYFNSLLLGTKANTFDSHKQLSAQNITLEVHSHISGFIQMFKVHADGARLIELDYSVFLVTNKKNSITSICCKVSFCHCKAMDFKFIASYSGGFRGFHRFQLKPPFRSLIVLTYLSIPVSLNDTASR